MAARAQIALAQLNVFALGQLHQLLDRAVDEPGVGHSHRHSLEIFGLDRAAASSNAR
jgi:hypothetical protein